MVKSEGEDNKNEETAWDEMKRYISTSYRRFENWMLPSKEHPLLLQILLFIVKLPVLLLLLLLSPIVIVVLIFVFFAAI